jgi:exopolyphosphatase/guanosine-5'-triphosphate,3'-diphosphate pyrophosphatase
MGTIHDMKEYSTIAAVDLGSNSFRLQVARVVDDQIYPLDSLREAVRLGAGLNAKKELDEASQGRAIAALQLFAERLRGLPPHAVRVVGTNTLRVAKNGPAFLKNAEAILGFPIEVIAGREEARLIYLGVAHSLPLTQGRRLVVDIGGGSTEFGIGTGYEPKRLESLYMGCVSYSRRFFADGKITKASLDAAELAAKVELQTIEKGFSRTDWDEAVGSSGTARALADVLVQSGFNDEGITRDGLAGLRKALLKAGDARKLNLTGLREDRIPVFPGGFAIMSAVFAELAVEKMIVASAALREGVLYDMVGRFHQRDIRDVTVEQFMRRYHVDLPQAGRVEVLALQFFDQLSARREDDTEVDRQYLSWAARLHEIGISIAHSGYHKHSAYIVENADMPGFSKMEQNRLSLLVRAQRRSLAKVQPPVTDVRDWPLILALRLAVILCRSRRDLDLIKAKLKVNDAGFRLKLDQNWIQANPLTEAALKDEVTEWPSVGLQFEVAAS